MTDLAELTPKAQQTRQHILDTALRLFAKNGFESTTMRDIAKEAKCSLGLAYRYFASKDDFVLALYWQFHHEWADEIAKMQGGSIAERFDLTMGIKVRQLASYREAMGSLFVAMLNPTSEVGVLSTNTIDLTKTVLTVFEEVVRGAKDAPKEKQVSQMALLLYSSHLLLQLFWLYDRTPNQRATKELLGFTKDSLHLLRRLIRLPFINRTLERLTDILIQVFVEQR